jgi:UDP:flavonoid glycosyltransferase YjiC (YdhE family)
MSKHLFVILSTHGHIFPAIKYAQSLQLRGDDVLFVAANEYFCLLNVYGIRCVGVTNSPHYFLSTVDWYTEEANKNQVRVIEAVVEDYRPDVIVTNPLVLSAFIIAERFTIETTVIGYCEYLYPEIADHNSPKQWRINVVTDYYNQIRRHFGLPGIAVDHVNSPLIGHTYLLRSIPKFHDYGAFPKQVKYAGGLYWEPDYTNVELDRFIAANRRENRPLVYVQIGRLFENHDAWTRLAAALEALPIGCIVDIGRSDYIGPHFTRPANFYLNSFVPIGYVKDDVNAIICSGQSTSVISAITHGKQLICVPHSADAKELTARVERKGIGIGIHDSADLQQETLSSCLEKIQSNAFADNVHEYQYLFHEWENGSRVSIA